MRINLINIKIKRKNLSQLLQKDFPLHLML